MATKKTEQFNAVGRRKKSIARVKMIPNGTGVITINARDINDYFALDTFKFIVRQPLELVNLTNKVDIIVRVNGGGVNGQAGAIRLGIARNLVKMDENMKKELKDAGFLTRDARAKERKKPGLKKARKSPQFSKR
ncbi:MAG: 30S ribosomal protein S9 [Clostridia bacterium]|nr:30S ribosomal protein S9 [Clostridia bacterium]